MQGLIFIKLFLFVAPNPFIYNLEAQVIKEAKNCYTNNIKSKIVLGSQKIVVSICK